MDNDIAILSNDYDKPVKIVFTYGKCSVCDTELNKYKSSFNNGIYNMESKISISGFGNKIIEDKLYCKKCEKWY